jgi:hypothetical protein
LTYKEYVTTVLGKFGLSSAEIEFILSESDLSPDTVVTPDNKVLLKTAIYKGVPLVMAGLQDVSEGGYSVKWNVAGIKAWYSLLASDLGLDDLLAVATPKVRDKSNRW